MLSVDGARSLLTREKARSCAKLRVVRSVKEHRIHHKERRISRSRIEYDGKARSEEWPPEAGGMRLM